MPARPTQKEFVEKVKHARPYLTHIGKYRGEKEFVLVKDEYDIRYLISAQALCLPSKIKDIRQAVNKDIAFRKKAWHGNKYYREGVFDIVSEYKTATTKVLIRGKYAMHLVPPSSLYGDYNVDIVSAVDKIEYLNNLIKDKNPKWEESGFKIVGEYTHSTEKIEVENKYGKCSITLNSILHHGIIPTINSAINPTEYLKNILKEKNIHYKNKEFSILDKYKTFHTKLLVKDRYGKCRITPSNLINGGKPSLRSAVNPENYLINIFKEIHGDRYDYSKFKYTNSKSKSVFICPEHGEFKQRCDHHLNGHGCRVCAGEYAYSQHKFTYSYSDWKRLGKISKNFDGFKVYIIRIYNSKESFYKVGRTFRSLDNRFDRKNFRDKYNYEVVRTYESDNSRMLCELERSIMNMNKKEKYKPSNQFHGWNECYNVLNIKTIDKMFKENLENE